ncbi:MAG TPA: hypothetical protein EYG57_07240 [Planctomycetes bacterium]|nr:hypothetical protein [Planctomycetaceae bacterium]HIM29335.1 hypothetical protein [Planctomycetota bacterium]
MINPEVIKQLEPFIVTSWHGHRNDSEIPAPVRIVWREKFAPQQQGRGPQRNQQSNVDLAVLNSKGQVVHWFDGMRHGPTREPLAQYTARELQRAARFLKVDDWPPRNRPVELPELDRSRGIRVFVSLQDNRMTAYQAPVVEVVPLAEQDWKLLDYPVKNRTVDASNLKTWLSEVYPPGVMERTDPRTKMAYKIDKIEGKLGLAAAGSNKDQRYAVLSGSVRFTDEGGDDFSYGGKLEVVLSYELDSVKVKTLRGVFEGIYPRVDRKQNRTRRLPLQAVFESL